MQFNLSFFLGEALIKTHKNWYKGEYLFFFKNIQKAKQKFKFYQDLKEVFEKYQIPKEILFTMLRSKGTQKDILDSLNLNLIKKTFNLVQKYIYKDKNIPELLHIYILENSNLIYDWLVSNEFKKSYLDNNHPYPALLNIDVLNEEFNSEKKVKISKELKQAYKEAKLSYKELPSEIAWEMNLPLPKNYKFVWLGGHGTGTEALKVFLSYHNILFAQDNFNYETGFQRYQKFLDLLLCNPLNDLNAIRLKDFGFKDFEKLCKLIQKECKFIFQLRDYFEIFASYANHRTRKADALMEFDMEANLDEIFNRFYYFSSGTNSPLKLELKNFISKPLDKDMGLRTCIMEYSMLSCFDNILDLMYIDMKDLIGEKTTYTMQKICYFLNLDFRQDKNYGEKILNNDLAILLPLTLDISKKLGHTGVKLLIILGDFNEELYEEITLGLGVYNAKYKILLEKKYLKLLNSEIIESLQKYFENFNLVFEQTLVQERQKLIKENEFIDIYRLDKNIREKLFKLCDYELTHIKEHRPDIVASWKYYKEFEKMCLDLGTTP